MTANASLPEIIDVVHIRRTYDDNLEHSHRHDHHVLSLLVAGGGKYRLGPLLLHGRAPWLTLLPQGDEDCCGLEGAGEAWYVLFHWPGIAFRPVGETHLRVLQNGHEQLGPRWIIPDGNLVAQAVLLFERMSKGLGRQDLIGQWRAQSALIELFGRFIEHPPAGANATVHRTLSEFRGLLERRACDAVAIDDLAQTVRLSADHLRVLFKNHYGFTPQEYRTSVRMSQAITLLRSSTLNVAEVAKRLGYQDPLYFSRAFHKHFGIPPSRVIRLFEP